MSGIGSIIKAVYYSLLFLSICNAAHARYDDGARYAFAGAPATGTIRVIDMQNHGLAGSLAIDSDYQSITASDTLKALIVAHPAGKALTLIDLASPRPDKYDYPLDLSPDYIKLSPLGDTLAIYDRRQQVMEIQAIKRRATLVRIENVDSNTEMTFKLDGSGIYWVNNHTGSLHTADLWSENRSLKLTEHGGGLSAMSRSINGSYGFISDALAGKVYVVDLNEFLLIKAVNVGGKPLRPWGTTDGTVMLIPGYESGTVSIISAVTHELLYTIGTIPGPVAVYSGWLDTVAIVTAENGDIALIDLLDRETVSVFHQRGSPGTAVISADSRILAVPLEESGEIIFLDLKSKSLLNRIDGPPGTRELSLAISGNLCH